MAVIKVFINATNGSFGVVKGAVDLTNFAGDPGSKSTLPISLGKYPHSPGKNRVTKTGENVIKFHVISFMKKKKNSAYFVPFDAHTGNPRNILNLRKQISLNI